MTSWENQCSSSINGLRCTLGLGHDGLHSHPGQIPETNLWWKCSPEDPVAQAIAQERERCAKVVLEASINDLCSALDVAAKIREGK